MDEVKKRLIQFVDYKEISNRKFARIISASPNILSTGSSLGSEILVKISTNYRELNMDWVLTGRGEMLVKKGRKNKSEDDETLLQTLADDGGEPYTKTKEIKILPLFSEAVSTIVTLKAGSDAAVNQQLLSSIWVVLQVLLTEQAEANAERLGISVEEAKALINEKLKDAGAVLSAGMGS
jgi:hypothetical protein